MQFMPLRHIPLNSRWEDDVDEIFGRLLQIEPSGELIAGILSHVRQLPLPSTQQSQLQGLVDYASDRLVVRNEKREPS